MKDKLISFARYEVHSTCKLYDFMHKPKLDDKVTITCYPNGLTSIEFSDGMHSSGCSFAISWRTVETNGGWEQLARKLASTNEVTEPEGRMSKVYDSYMKNKHFVETIQYTDNEWCYTDRSESVPVKLKQNEN